MRYALFALFLAACGGTAPSLSQTNGAGRALVIENPTNRHILVKVHCEDANMGGSEDEHDFLVHPFGSVAAPVSGVKAGHQCYVVGAAEVGPNEICAGARK